MRVNFDGIEYKKNGRHGNALKDFCFSVFKKFLRGNADYSFIDLQKVFNQWHCNNRKVLLTEQEWNKQTVDGKTRYFKPVEYNGEKLYFTTQWGNNGGDCDNINHVIDFAKQQGYEIEVLDSNSVKYDSEKNKSSNGSNEIIIHTKNLILYGPPGVGKTYNYIKIVTMIESDSYDQKRLFDAIVKNDEVTDIDIDNDFKRIKEEGRVEFVTFHQSFSYEDFIEGFRPNEEGKIELDDGVFKRLAEKADENPAQNFYLVIDEINRGNISKIFGELITLIEEDKRDVIEVTLPYSKEPFSVPSNLYIIATMNSTDKSIVLIDIALRRRFTFLKMQPDVRLVKEEAKTLFEKLNAFISEKLGADFQIGHSYFMDYDNLGFVIDYKIVPLLEEYFFADPEGLSQARAILGKSGN